MVLLFFQIRYQLLSFDENLISDTLSLFFPALKKTPQIVTFFSTLYISVRFLDSKTHFFHILQLPLQQLFHFQTLHK